MGIRIGIQADIQHFDICDVQPQHDLYILESDATNIVDGFIVMEGNEIQLILSTVSDTDCLTLLT